MNRLTLAVLLALSTGCASTTVIRSHPSGATVRNMKGEKVGKTPYSYSGSGIINSAETFTVDKPGFEETAVTVRRDQVNGVMMAALGVSGLVFLPLALVTWPSMLWAADYQPVYNVELSPVPEENDDGYEDEEGSDERRASRRDDDDEDGRDSRRGASRRDDDRDPAPRERSGRRSRAVSARGE